MINRFLNPLFLLLILFGTLLSISSNNILTIWIGLEINLLAFIPLMIYSNNQISATNLIKYYLIQSITSFLILFTFIVDTVRSSIIRWDLIVTSALLVKMGIPPYHFWLPAIIRSLSWVNCLILSTVQKIAPLILILSRIQLSKATVILLAISLIISTIGGLKQTSFRPILAYSSIHHIVWCILGLLHRIPLFLAYFSFYCVTCLILFLFLNKYHTDGFIVSRPNYWCPTYLTPIISILSIAGLPPLLGFFPKLYVLQSVISTRLILAFLLILRSSLNMLFYIRFTYSFITDKYPQKIKKETGSCAIFGVRIYAFSHLPILIIFLVYALNILH